MKNILILLIFITVPTSLFADGSIQVPWEEIKKLYQKQIEQKYKEKLDQKKALFKYTIETADYRIAIHEEKALGDLTLSGRVVSGKPESFPIYDKSIIISKINQVTGGNIISGRDQDIHFLPDQAKSFHLKLSFLLPVLEDSKSRYVSFNSPRALKNRLGLIIPPGIRLLSRPGLKTGKGVYHFSAKSSVKIRFSNQKELKVSKVVEVDSLARIRIQGKQAIVTAFFYPIQSISGPFIMEMPGEAMYLSSSLKKSWITKKSRHSFQIKPPRGFNKTFIFEFAYNETELPGNFSIFLPTIKDNNGNQGIFTLLQPENGQILITGKKTAIQVPVNSLNKKLYFAAKHSVKFLKIPVNEKIDLKIRRYQAVAAPAVVLDSVSLFSSFEENGNILTLLVLEVPSEAGSRLNLKAIPGAEIWHLKVNQRKVKIYGDQGDISKNREENRWIIPLETGKASHVELAYIRKGEKIGLHGRLDTIMPEIGLPAKTIHVGIGLPKRVELLSLEGPVSPLMEFSQPVPPEFVGKPYYFSRSFYNGGRMNLAISYKEPVNAK